MKKLVATLAIAAGLVVAAPAEAYVHQHGSYWYGGQGNPLGLDNNSTVTADEARRACTLTIVWAEDYRPVTASWAHDRINSSALYVSATSPGGVLHSCLVDWDAGGKTPGYTVTLYIGYRP